MSHNAASPPPTSDLLDSLDDSKISRFQIKIMFVSGMGFFTDAYDLFVIGIVVYLLTSQWNLSTSQVSLLNSITLAASAVGALIFGRVADILGRKRIYGYEVLILAIGAIASAFSPNYTFLLISRAVLGIGIGGDYPVSATIMSEYAGKNTRGRMVGAVFANQAAGLIVGPLIASIFLASGLSDNLTWRLLLGLGAIPGLAVFYLRRQIHETPRFAMAGGATEEAEAAIAAATGKTASGAPAPRRLDRRGIEGEGPADRAGRLPDPGPQPPDAAVADRRRGLLGAARLLLLRQHHLDPADPGPAQPEGLGAAQHPGPAADLRGVRGAGYVCAILFLDKTGRKTIQTLGFGMMALMFLLLGLIPSATTVAATFIILYGISYFFTEFGPNTTTFIYPSEIFPVEVRTTASGIAAGAGKMGAFAGAYLFPDMLAASMGLRGAEIVAGVVAAVGMLLTIFLLPEPKGKSLEELTEDAYAPPEVRRQEATA